MESFKEVLDRIEADMAEVKRQYDLFFQGARRSEPTEERRILEWMVRRTGQRRIINTSDQFRFHGLQSRFHALASLWSRMVRDYEEGRLSRDASGSLVRPPASSPAVPVDPGHLEETLARMKSARQECGLPAGEKELAAIRQALVERAGEIAGKTGAKTVEFRISVEEGKPRVKAVVR